MLNELGWSGIVNFQDIYLATSAAAYSRQFMSQNPEKEFCYQ